MNNNITTDKRILTSKENASLLLKDVLSWLEDGKAEEMISIDLQGKADFAYYIVIATGRSSKHIASLGDDIADKLKAKGLSHIGIEGQAVGDWVLIDAHDIVIHLFREEIRSNYQLEKIWEFSESQDK